MFILRKNIASKKITFKDIKIGECFYLDFLYLIKINNDFLGDCICLTTGERRMVFHHAKVILCDKEINN